MNSSYSPPQPPNDPSPSIQHVNIHNNTVLQSDDYSMNAFDDVNNKDNKDKDSIEGSDSVDPYSLDIACKVVIKNKDTTDPCK